MQNLQQLYLLEMQKQFDSSKLSKSIQIKGMKGLSLPYIQRFFSHAGQVEQVKKIQDLVIVRFKNQASINKALRFNGRFIDRQPIKIRGATPYLSLQQMPHKKINTTKENSKKNQQIDEMIKNRAFDVPFLWANILKIISKLQDDKIMWLIHEIFFLKLSQIIHFHAFGTNARSTYAEITIKQNFVNETKNNINLAQIQGKIQKLQIISIPSNDLLDEPNFECFLSNVDTRLKLKFREIFKAIQGDRLHDLYLLFHAYSLYIPADQSIFSNENNLSNSPFSVSKQLITERRARISLQDGRYIHKRSQYRQIDNNHPSKQIQILSDAKLNENSYQYTTYDIFRDDFDGNISNNCAADIFFHFRIHFVPNYIIVRYRQSGRLHYFRLDFELRLLNCHDQVIPTYDFCTFMEYESSGQIKKLTQIKLLKHNLVISDYQKTQKAIYLLQNYIKYVMPNHHHHHQPQQHQNQQNIISIFLILSNESEQKLQQIKQLAKQVFSHQGITSIQNKLYVINIHDTDKFQKFKCCNFIEEYVDQQKGTFNLEIARAHAKKLIEENPSKFQLGFNAQQFTTQIIWKLQQQKSKRSAKNRIKMQVQNVRNK